MTRQDVYESIDKVVRIGTVKTYGGRWANVYCRITYKNGRLSITGVVGPLPSGGCLGSCGQINADWTPIVNYAKGWTPSKVRRFLDIWDRWHLNDMQAGTPEQTEFVKAYCKEHKRANYDEICSALKTAGLYEVIRADGTLYKYGHAWLFESVPTDVLQFLDSLPVSDKVPAWC
jgi:hypothetical protein